MIQGAAFRILACFFDRDECGFVELCESAGYATDLGGYYIRQLVQGGYLKKVSRGTYAILPKGKQELALRYGKSARALKPRLAVLLVAKQQDKFVVLRRARQPFIGSAEWLAGEVQAAESVSDAVERILEVRLGCTGKAQLVGFFRRTDMHEGKVFDDKLFAVHTVMLADDAVIKPANNIGEILLCGQTELAKLSKPAKSLHDIFRYSQSAAVPLEAHAYDVSLADLSA